MQVIAQRPGFYADDFKPAGAVFTVRAGEAASWFVPVQSPAVATPVSTAGTTLGKPPPAPKLDKPRSGRPRGRPAGSGSAQTNLPPAPKADAPDSP